MTPGHWEGSGCVCRMAYMHFQPLIVPILPSGLQRLRTEGSLSERLGGRTSRLGVPRREFPACRGKGSLQPGVWKTVALTRTRSSTGVTSEESGAQRG